jgi:hypothetical protein
MLFHVQRLPTDSSTTMDHIRERGTTIVADTFDAAASRWCEQNREDVDLLYDFELAIADSDGKHRMFTVTPTVALTFRASKYQGLE